MKKIEYVYKYQHRKNFLDKRRELKGMRIKYTEDKRKWAVEFVDMVNDYDGQGFIIDKNSSELVDFFPTIYTLKHETNLRILPA